MNLIFHLNKIENSLEPISLLDDFIKIHIIVFHQTKKIFSIL